MERVATIVGSLIGGIILGALPVWVLMQKPPETKPDNSQPAGVQEKSERVPAAVADEQLKSDLRRAREDADAAKSALSDTQEQLRSARAEGKAATEQLERAQQDVKRLEGELAQARAGQPQPAAPRAPITYGKWAEMPELRDANWQETGGAAKAMIPMLKQLAEMMEKGEQPPPALMQKIGEENRKLISLYAKVIGKLPTHSSVNGEFAHPFLLMNMLAMQLQAAGEPLSEDQKAAIARHGEDYDRRWEALQKGYTEHSFKLEKKLDEADLKEWFKAQMLAECTPEQRAIAVPPEVEGIIGLDLYSAGLIFSSGITAAVINPGEQAQPKLADALKAATGIDDATLESAAFLLDEWVRGIPDLLEPKSDNQLQLYRTADVMQAGRAQLRAGRVLYNDYARDQKVKDALRGAESVILPLARAG